jgi:hypothetical protein
MDSSIRIHGAFGSQIGAHEKPVKRWSLVMKKSADPDAGKRAEWRPQAESIRRDLIARRYRVTTTFRASRTIEGARVNSVTVGL